VPNLTVARELEIGELVAVTVTELELKRVLRLIHRRHGALSYAATAFLRTVRDLARRNGPPFYYQVEKAG
jgi:DNA-binding transcriptional LysR family regulator